MIAMTPREIVQELDRFIVGQNDAKKAVAIALRNRWRRQMADESIRNEITPKNILMIGPTGVGKTEIARRLAKLANAPFIKVEATKFTEVGYVGREVDSIIRDLMDIAIKMVKEQSLITLRPKAEEAAIERILNILLPPPKTVGFANEPQDTSDDNSTRQKFRKKLIQGELDDKEIDLEISDQASNMNIMTPPGMEEMAEQLQAMFSQSGGGKKQTKRMKIKDAIKVVQDEEALRLVNQEEIKAQAVKLVENQGIVFIDEIDKVCRRGEYSGSDVSREGVQRDLLPLVEGSTISTKFGPVKTDHILFIASGAFHLARPSDLIPELQGRLPIRVELNPLKVEDFVKILTEPSCALTKQYQALLATEEVELSFDDDALKELAKIAYEVNERTENIGARRLHTILERLLEEISFSASDQPNTKVHINAETVREKLGNIVGNEDLSRFIL